MARGRKKTVEEQIEDLQKQVDSAESRLRGYQTKLKELMKKKKEQETKKLHEFIEHMELSAEEAMAILEGHKR